MCELNIPQGSPISCSVNNELLEKFSMQEKIEEKIRFQSIYMYLFALSWGVSWANLAITSSILLKSNKTIANRDNLINIRRRGPLNYAEECSLRLGYLHAESKVEIICIWIFFRKILHMFLLKAKSLFYFYFNF